MITHVVLFKLKNPTPENLEKTKEVLLNMEGKIPQLREIVVGIDLLRSPPGRTIWHSSRNSLLWMI